MSCKKYLTFSVSAIAISLVSASYAEAQQNLPTINVGGARRNNNKVVNSGVPTGGRATGASSATGGNGGGTGGFALDRYAEPKPAPFSRTLPNNIPAVVESRTREEIFKQVNIMTSAEAFKYLPSVMVRERYIGDNNAIVTMRTNGPTESANTLVYANGILLSNLIGNSFAYPPRWGFVSPEEIDRVDVIYGPFSALYQGNSVSGVMTMTTKMPDAREIHVRGMGAAQQWSLYNHSSVPLNGNINIYYGDRINDFRYIVTYNHLNNNSQPMTFAGGQLTPAPTTASSGTWTQGYLPFFGGYMDYNMYGVPRVITGANGIIAGQQDLAKVRMSYDITPKDRVEYMSGFWTQVQDSNAESYIKTTTGVPIYNTQFSSGTGAVTALNVGGPFTVQPGAMALQHTGAQHLMNALSMRRDSGGTLDYDFTLTSYNYLRDFTNTTSNYGFLPCSYNKTCINKDGSPVNYTINPTGQNTIQSGTYWRTGDARFIYRPERELLGKHEISYGVHSDQYSLNQNQTLTEFWPSSVNLGTYNSSTGKTTLNSVYVQDAWKVLPSWKIIAGVRDDYWNASNGQGASGAAGEVNLPANYQSTGSVAKLGNYPLTAYQYKSISYGGLPTSTKNGFQPKAALEYQMTKDFNIRGSMGRAYRMPTVAELYLASSQTGSTTINNPNLQPQVSTAYDLTFAYRKVDAFNGSVGLLAPRVSLFMEDRWNSIFSQSVYSSQGVNTTQSANIGKALFRGIEAELVTKDMLIKGLDYSGSVTFTDSHIVSNDSQLQPYFTGNVFSQNTCWPGVCNTNGPLLAGNQYPRIPRIRIRSILTYSPTQDMSVAFGARFATATFVTLSNIDFNHNTYGSSDSQYLFFDAKLNYKFEKNWTATVGIDNIGSYRAYVNPNPYPQRTYFAGIRYDFEGPNDAKIKADQLGNSGAYAQGGPGSGNPSGTVH